MWMVKHFECPGKAPQTRQAHTSPSNPLSAWILHPPPCFQVLSVFISSSSTLTALQVPSENTHPSPPPSQTAPGKATQIGNRVHHQGSRNSSNRWIRRKQRFSSCAQGVATEPWERDSSVAWKTVAQKGSKWIFQDFKNGLFPGHGQLMNLDIG